MSFAHDSSFSRGIVAHQRDERVTNHNYFHNEGGQRYWHRLDNGGLNWYGFYLGPQFFWFPFFSGYWWWYDENLTRWVYWWNGYWWWMGPNGVPYLYVSDNYVPYDQYQPQTSDASSQESAPQPPSAPPTTHPSLAAASSSEPPSAPPMAQSSVAISSSPASKGVSAKSPDGKRLVQIVGADGGAFLFDESKTPRVFMKYLGGNAETVRFVGGTSGQILSIIVNFKDGTFNMFDAEGNPPVHSSTSPAAPAQGD
jgi:hypothetical protein